MMANSPTTGSSSKRFKADQGGINVDRISNLPEALILRILSFLPTKMVVATSLVSKRWVPVRTLVPTLDFQDSDSDIRNNFAKAKFIQFVYNALLLNKSGSVETLRLNCHSIYGRSCINTWICSALNRGLQEADIAVYRNGPDQRLFKLPSGLFLVKTLKVLKLGGDILMVDLRGPISLPSLKILHLRSVNYGNDESFSWLLSGCLVLQELVLMVELNKLVNINISSPTMETLCLTCTHFQDRVEIDAPALKQLKLQAYCLNDLYVVKHFSCLITADIFHLHAPPRVNYVGGHHLFTALSNVKCLKLHSVCVLSSADSFPRFVNLTRLELYGANLVVVSLFLQNSNKLETLDVGTKEMFTQIMYGVDVDCWRQPNQVPKCFLSCLTRVCFRNVKGSEDELRMVGYFLNNARVLRTMEIYTKSDLSLDSKLCILKKLSMMPRFSQTCQLLFN